MKAEVSAAVSAVSVSTAEAKREKITNTLNKVFLSKKQSTKQTFPLPLSKKALRNEVSSNLWLLVCLNLFSFTANFVPTYWLICFLGLIR